MSDNEEDYGSDSSEEGQVLPTTATTSKTKKKKRKAPSASQPDNKKRSKKGGLIDDAAVESGESDEEEESDDEDNNDYERDGFVVDDADDEPIKKRAKANTDGDGLEDSDEDDDDDDDEDDDASTSSDKKKKKLRKMREVDELDEDDLALINEAKGITSSSTNANGGDGMDTLNTAGMESSNQRYERKLSTVKAKSAQELSRGLFTGDTDSEDDDNDPNSKGKQTSQSQQQQKPERYDEDGLDDFIEDDTGYGLDNDDDDDYGRSGVGGSGRDKGLISQAQMDEAEEIFGTDYLDFMDGGAGADGEDGDEGLDEDYDPDSGRVKRRKSKFKEAGVGVALGVDSDEEIEEDSTDSEDDDDDDDAELFGDDDMEDDMGYKQRAEVLKLKREKKRLAREERRRLKRERADAKRKAQLRRAFEPVQLVENFCTEKDDEIRMADCPERYYDWLEGKKKTLTRKIAEIGDEFDLEEEEEAMWIMRKISAFSSEIAVVANAAAAAASVGENSMLTDTDEDAMEKAERSILDSIIYALRYMRGEKLEPEFIKRYRMDIVTSPAVRENLYRIMDEDSEWERMTEARNKIEGVLQSFREEEENPMGGKGGPEVERAARLKEQFKVAEEKLNDTVEQERKVQEQLDELDKAKAKGGDDDDDDDDDDLFGDDDEEDDEAAKAAKEEKKEALKNHLNTLNTLLSTQAEEVARLDTSYHEAEAAANAASSSQDSGTTETISEETMAKMCRDKLWHYGDYSQYASSMTEHRHIMDMKGYLNLIKEGNEAIKDKAAHIGGVSSSNKDKKKRSRRFDWDYYRTCVSEGLRGVCYKFVLPPFRVGIKLEETLNAPAGFSYDHVLPGEDNEDEMVDPSQWVAPVVEGTGPKEFADELIGNGELVMLSNPVEGTDWDKTPEMNDPLRACRYVAAMELAQEPRIRRQLRALYRAEAVITTRPTAKGMGAIDAFHEYYGLHLIHAKPVKEHFRPDDAELERKRAHLNADELKELDTELKKREANSCIQYLNLLKAERSGDITVQVHLPFVSNIEDAGTPWYKLPADKRGRDRQDVSRFMEALERVYFPANGDTDEWNEERRKVLRTALVNYLLPQFEAETRRDLKDASTRIGVEAAAQNLNSMAMTGPYRPSHLLGESRFIVPTGELPIVGVCSSNDAKDGTFLAAVNEKGELIDHLAIPGGTSVTSDKMKERVITFLMQTRPVSIVVGSGGGVSARATNRKLSEVLTQATERWNNRLIQGQDEDDEDFEERMETFRKMYPHGDDDDEIDWKCNVDIVDDNVAQLFGRSVRGKKEFPDTAVNLKVAIATARWAKDPLSELAYTWSAASDAGVFGTEMLFLNVHPLQRLLPKPLLLREYERVLCNVVADVGVDLYGACKFDHLQGLLSFVPGLGPRKANNLKQSVARVGGAVASRRAILAKRLLGPIVYNNSVAFLRIRATDELQDNLVHPLDDSRCHPDVYQRNKWAVKIAVDALELGDSVAGDNDEQAIDVIRDVMRNSRNEVERLYNETKKEWESRYGQTFIVNSWEPKTTVPAESWRDKVEELDLETFASMIEQQSGLGKWLSHLNMIKWEFRLPFQDPRKPMEPPTGGTLFRLLTGETDATLCPGKEVTGKVIKNGDFGSQVKLEGDVPGFIPLRNLADDHVESAEDIVQVGTVVTALITQVKMEHMSVDLSLKKEDFKKKSSEWERPQSLPPLDDHFDRAAALTIDEEKDKERQSRMEALRLTIGTTNVGDGETADGQPVRRSGKVTRRACAHPAFRNAKHDEVDRELKEAGDAMVGEALIRPSNKSCDSLAIHWMVRAGCIKVIEVLEQDKDTDASIGNKLIIKKEIYESIDELLGRYIAPMNDRVEEVLHHRKFLDMLEDQVDSKLETMKRAQPQGVFYFICWSESYPGYVSLRFIMSKTPRHHTIGVSPDGFVWGPKTYSSMDRLMNDFKKNPAGPGVKLQNNRPGSSASSLSSRTSAATGVKTDDSSRQSRWGARSNAPPSRWGNSLPPPMPPPGPPPNFAPPPGQPPTFAPR